MLAILDVTAASEMMKHAALCLGVRGFWFEGADEDVIFFMSHRTANSHHCHSITRVSHFSTVGTSIVVYCGLNNIDGGYYYDTNSLGRL